jgi:hypothetical protein
MASRTTHLINALKKAGFTLLRHNRHMVWGCPCGHDLITIASTKQTGSGDTAAYALMNRILRGCEQRRKEAA